MINLSAETLQGVEEYAKVTRELLDFEAEIKKHEGKAEKLRVQQNEKFTFDRANELNALTLSIDQAIDTLRKRKLETEKLLGARPLKLKISNEVGRFLEEDDELLNLEMTIKKNVDAILTGIAEYRTLFKFKRDQAKEAIHTLSDENLNALTIDLSIKSEIAPFNNLLLERAIRNYKTPEANN